MNCRSKIVRSMGIGFLVGGASVAATGCEVGRDFRAAAGPAFHQGVTLIVNGFIDGIFAAAAPEPSVSDNSAASSR